VTTLSAVKEALEMGWYATHEVRDYVYRVTGKYRSTEGISARIRDLRKKRYGDFTVAKRPASNGGDHFEYRINTKGSV